MTAPGRGRPVPLSRRTEWDLSPSRLAGRLDQLQGVGHQLLDLTQSNPTRCGFAWPEETLARSLAAGPLARYEPCPAGARAAREAIASYLAELGDRVDPDRVVLTASTSEAYGFLLKLLCDPGDEVLVPAPGYPLLDLLCDAECVRAVSYPLRYDGDWHLDLDALAASVTPRSRALVVVSPANPTGWLLGRAELAQVAALCAARGLALVGDEVFADGALGQRAGVLSSEGCLAFHLSGLSKVCGLPQLKLGWIAVSGPADTVRRAVDRLHTLSDTYLSVAGPAQVAAPVLLRARARFLRPLSARLERNRSALARAVDADAPFTLLRSAGGWSAVLRLGETADEEALCLALLDDGVIVQPGWLYDFERKGHLVLSLLPEPDVFDAGVERVVLRCARWWEEVSGA